MVERVAVAVHPQVPRPAGGRGLHNRLDGQGQDAKHLQRCGGSSPKWLGKCPSCGEWNTLEETIAQAAGTIGYELMCALAPRVPTRPA